MLPLAAALRPKTLSEVYGQSHLVGPKGVLRKMVDKKMIKSMILWGPPGIGKTTISKAISQELGAQYIELNATSTGTKDVRNAITQAQKLPNVPTIVFIDEINRYSRNQQDVLLPAVEDGTIYLIGAMMENPKFALNSAILSRCSVYELKPLDKKDSINLLIKIRKHYEAKGTKIHIEREAADLLIIRSNGDARKLMTAMETMVDVLTDDGHITIEHVQMAIPDKHMTFDRYGNEHYDNAHIYQQCIQNSDVDGAVYWLMNWIASGEDEAYICRRMMVTAFEDCAANPLIPIMAMAAHYMTERVGPPECHIGMALTTILMAQSPRNKTGYDAMKAAKADVLENPSVRIPPNMRAGTDDYILTINAKYVFSDLMQEMINKHGWKR